MNLQGIQQLRVLFSAVAVGATLAGCSAGGGNTTTTPTPAPAPTPTAASLNVTVDKNTLSSTGADTATITVTALDANNNVVSAIPVTFKSDSGTLTPSGSATGAAGTLTGVVGIGSDHSDRAITVSITSGTLTKSVAVNVQGDTLTGTAGANVSAGASATIQYTLLDAANVAISGAPITVSIPGQADVSDKTDVNGKYSFAYTMPSSASTVTATAGGVTTTTAITPANGTTVYPTAGAVTSASLSANPSSVSTSQPVELRALFIGANNAPIPNVRVRFDMLDSNSIGGTLSSDTSPGVHGTMYSDPNGIARSTYTAGSRGGVIVPELCWDVTDFAAGTCPNHVSASSLTVVASGVSVAALTNGLVGEDDTKNIYTVAYVVQVVDASNTPIAGSTVTGSVDLPRFYRGAYTVNGSKWTSAIYTDSGEGTLVYARQSCDNEDINRNNVLETGEDANGSKSLEPFKASVTITPTSAGSNVTDIYGKAYLTLQYGQNYATWEDATLTFTTAVEGTEGHTVAYSTLPVPATTLSGVTVDPPFKISPYNASNGLAPYAVTIVPVANPGVIYASQTTFNLCGVQH